MECAYATMEKAYQFTRHAHQRSAERNIPPFVMDVIITYGRSIDAGDGARKYALTKECMRDSEPSWARYRQDHRHVPPPQCLCRRPQRRRPHRRVCLKTPLS